MSEFKIKPGSWQALAIDHVRAHGGQWHVVDRKNDAQRQQWRAWMAYFAWLDGQTWPRGHKAATFGKMDKITVPTAWPLEFDASAPPSPLPEPEPAPVSAERRRELANMLRAAVRSTGPDPDRPKPPTFSRDAPPQDWDARLEALRAEYAANPIRPPAREEPNASAF